MFLPRDLTPKCLKRLVGAQGLEEICVNARQNRYLAKRCDSEKVKKDALAHQTNLSALSHHLTARYADAMGREPTERTPPDLFPTATASASPETTPQRYALPNDLRNAIKHLSDDQLDLMHAATVEELKRRGRTPKSAEADLPARPDLTRYSRAQPIWRN
jgi:hypothetical protein